MLVFASAVQGICFSFIGPARMAFTGDLVGRDKLANAVALQQLSMRSTQVVGPALAGVLIGVPFVGVAGLYYINTTAYIICVGLMFFLPKGEPIAREEITSPLADLADGLRYVQRHANLKLLILTSFVVIALGYPYESFLPAIVEELFDKGPTAYGLMSSGIATGAIISTVVVAGLVDSPNAWRMQLVAAVAVGAGLIALGFSPGFIVALVVIMPFLGAMSSGFQSLNASLAMVMTDDQYQGRVMSINMLSFGLFGFAALPIGLLADAIGLRQTFVVLGVVLASLVVAINLGGAIAGVRNRRLRSEPRTAVGGGGR
jgi:MFS family permease